MGYVFVENDSSLSGFHFKQSCDIIPSFLRTPGPRDSLSRVLSDTCLRLSSSPAGRLACRAVLTLCVRLQGSVWLHTGSLVQVRPEPLAPRTCSPHPPQPSQQLQANYSYFLVWVVMVSINFSLGL